MIESLERTDRTDWAAGTLGFARVRPSNDRGWSEWRQSMQYFFILTCSLLLVLTAKDLPAQSAVTSTDTKQTSEQLFVRRIAPLLREKCLGCHGNDPDEIEGSLDVRSLTGLLKGGDSEEPSIVPGQPDQSPFFLAANRQSDDWSAMPPKEAEKLTPDQLNWLSEWIATGAQWPDAKRRKEIEDSYADEWSVEDGTAVETSGGLSADWTNRKYDPDGLWAYQPVRQPMLHLETHSGTNVRKTKGVHPIDMLIEQAMPDGISVAPRADRRTLIRRATFDLTGLPPTPDEVADFVNDRTPDREAFAKVVDRLLDSPHYGERMAQHWLDVVRYADSSGFANDYERGNAWRYRDYVVRSFNDDKPYDEFVREQIAGDEIDPDDPEKIIATGFLRMGPWELTAMEVAKVARQRFLDDVTNSVGETFLAHSLQCARCHDHKFDPVPTRDYYSIQAVFATTQLAERKAKFLEAENTAGFEEQSYLAKTRRSHEKTLAELDQVLLQNAQEWFDKAGGDSTSIENLPEENLPEENNSEENNSEEHNLEKRQATIAATREKWDQAVARRKADGQKTNLFNAARSEMRKAGIPESDYPPKLVGFTPQQFGRERVARKGLERLAWELERYQPYALAVYNGLTESPRGVYSPTRVPKDRLKQGELEQTAILVGGDPFSPSQEVSPGTLSVVNNQVQATIPSTITERRTAFANWVADARNPLTPRVMVNRLWLWHFGEAIAGNPNNFGSTGKRPTHPQLLDWLATTFIADGWSIKAMHRRIMSSDAYCRSAQYVPAAHASGASKGMHSRTAHSRDHHDDNVDIARAQSFYAVFRPRRLSAEELRDSMLSVSGELNPTLGGIPCRPEINQEVALQPRQVMGTFAAAWTPNPLPQQRNRRSIYVLRLRGLIPPILEVFNSPAPDFSCERREASTVTPQVFSLFNGQNTYTRALSLAVRALNETDNDRDAIRRCFQLVLSREPSLQELDEFLTHWRENEASLPEQPPARRTPPLEVVRKAVEENTGELFTFTEHLYSNKDFVPDRQPADVDSHVRALSDVCLVMLNSNEFVYVY